MARLTCKSCGLGKNHSEFYKHRFTASGYETSCKICTRARSKRWRAEKPEKVNEQHKLRDPNKIMARRRLNDAIRKGRIKKPICCEHCGLMEKLHGHHEDYSKPLEVIWLCPTCHSKLHFERGDRLR